MKVLGKKVAVRVLQTSATQTPSGLYIAPSADTAQVLFGAVSHVGDEVENITVGETVHFNKFGAPEVTVDGIKYHIVTLSDVLAVS